MDFGKTVLLFISALGIALWIGLIIRSEGEHKYVEACHPVSLTTKYIIKITTGLTGFTPQWTIKAKEVLDSGCYYFFATFMFQEDLGEGVEGQIRRDVSGSGGGGVHR